MSPSDEDGDPERRFGGIRRAVEDYDFDRLEVEVRQRMKLTSTNRPFGLIIKLSQTVFGEEQTAASQEVASQKMHSSVRFRVEPVMPANSVVTLAA